MNGISIVRVSVRPPWSTVRSTWAPSVICWSISQRNWGHDRIGAWLTASTRSPASNPTCAAVEPAAGEASIGAGSCVPATPIAA